MMTVRTILVVALAITCAGCGGGKPAARALPAPQSSATGGDTPSPKAAGPVVDVAGAVRVPGVYRMHVGARVHEAIEAAGGLAPGADVANLNRAAPVVDGQQVLVLTANDAPGTGERGGPAGGAGATVSINAADVTQLDTLPGIGPVTAQRIVDERTSGGPFASLDDLDRVSGIGPATIESLRDIAVV